MYAIFSQISNFFSQPFMNIAYSVEGIPLASAFVLGIVGAMAPCQFTGNIGAITLYGNRSMQEKLAWKEVIYFIIGKITAFSLLGLLVWLLGREFQQSLTLYFPWFRKVIGPILILMGIYLMGFFKMTWNLQLIKIPDSYFKKSKFGSFLMGLSFSLAFCPTMFILFFVTLMPIVLSTSYGVILPTIFALGTSIPVLIALFIIWYFGLAGSLMKKGRKLGKRIQMIAGIIIIIIGIFDTITYWA
ncbi:sulfite exporter TauE/SafE family protein [Bacillus sp. SCS-151]|uniref:urease accessory protein UreH domain-containing protein n=1 Tax=Nanhaiella sioensis TaxID=3115293 RepID=UPI00397D86C1